MPCRADLREVNWLAILIQCTSLTITLVVPEAVLHADDDPVVRDTSAYSADNPYG